MNAERWREVKSVLDAALDAPTRERAAIIASLCGSDEALREDVESLFDADDQAFLDRPAFGAAAFTQFRDAETMREGTRIGEFRIVRELGRGGMGTVYLAERDDGEFHSRVAIKVVTPGRNAELVVRRFRQERQILAGLEHPNIARLFSGGTTDEGRPYFVMEYVEGEPIDAYCEREALTVAQRLELFRSVCAAVSYAHQHLVVHRDIKPANILVTVDGTPKLLDFGIAKVLDDGNGVTPVGEPATTVLAMTPDYASPEQRAGISVTTLTDVYSLGVVLYQLVAGTHPRLNTESARPSTSAPHLERALRGDVDNIVLMAMREEPTRRYASPALLSEDIRRHLTGLPVTARPDTFGYRATKFVQRNRVGVVAGALAAVAITVAVIGTAWQARIARTERARAETQRMQAERRFGEVRELATSFLFELDAQIATLPGATPARESLVKRALASLDGLARDAHEDLALLRDLAAAYVRVGDVQGKPYAPNLGHTDAALASYGKAVVILQQLTTLSPSDAELSRALARAYQSRSSVQARTGDVDGAIATQRRAVSLCDSLLRADSSNVADRTLLADNLSWLGRALYQKRTVTFTTEALAAYRRSHELRDDLAMREPGEPLRKYAAGVAGAYEGYALWQIGDLTGDTANYRAALQRLRASHDINTALGAAMPTNVTMKRASVDALHEMALLNLKLRDGRAALVALNAALPTTQALAAADPRNAEAQRDLATLIGIYASTYASLHDATRALASAERARAMVVGLNTADATSADDMASLSELDALIGSVHQSSGALSAAISSYERARDEAVRWQRLSPSSDGPQRLIAAHDAALSKIHDDVARASQSVVERSRHEVIRCELARDATAHWDAIQSHGTLAPVDTLPATIARKAAAQCAPRA